MNKNFKSLIIIGAMIGYTITNLIFQNNLIHYLFSIIILPLITWGIIEIFFKTKNSKENKDYNKIKSLSEAINIIKEQDTIIGKQYRQIIDLENSEIKRKNWIREAKKQAGYDDNISFDDVWRVILEKAKNNNLN